MAEATEQQPWQLQDESEAVVNGFIQAKNFTSASRVAFRLIVIHTMENSEKPGTAHGVAAWFGSVAAPQASAHLCVDAVEVWGCVHEKDVAWAAPGANRDGYHIEHAGRAAQTGEQWADAYSMAMLRLSAKSAADIAQRYAIPTVWLSVEEVIAGAKGFCGHHEITMAYHKSNHTDPGTNFPREQYLDMVRDELALLAYPEPAKLEPA